MKKSKKRRIASITSCFAAAAIILCILAAVPSTLLADAANKTIGTAVLEAGAEDANIKTEAAADSEKKEEIKIAGEWKDKHPVVLRGAGTLEAEGTGAVRIKGKTDGTSGGTVEISGNGVLIVRDIEGDINKSITGYGGMVELGKDSWMYYGFNGNAEIRGSGFAINLFGEDIELYARGKAIVFLAGEGSFNAERFKKVEKIS